MKTKNTVFQNVLEMASVFVLIAMVTIVFAFWNELPDEVPLHYNFRGEIDRWGNKIELLICPIIGVVMFAILTFMSHAPKLWNMAVEPVAENREELYTSTKSMLLLLKLEMMLIFFYIFFAAATVQKLSEIFLPVVITTIFATLGYYIYEQIMIDRRTKRRIIIDSEVTRLKNTFPVSKYWLIFPVVLLMFPYLFVAIDKEALALLYAFLISVEILPFCVLYFFAAKGKSKFYSEHEDLNMALNRIRIREWTKFWVLAAHIAAINGIICFGILQANRYVLTISTIVIYFAHIVISLWLCKSTRSKVNLTVRVMLEGKK